MTRFKGILFDYDGTLARSMEDHFRSWQAVLAEKGVSISTDEYYPLEGMGLHEVAEWFTKAKGLPSEGIDDLIQRKKAHYLKIHRLEFYPGVETFITELHRRKVPMGIVTGSHRDQLQRSAPEPFLSQFDVLVTGEAFKQGKPNPEPYLVGVRKLGLHPQECIAVENAPLGIQSAVGAKLYCIAVCSTVGPEQLSGAQEILPSFSDLKKSNAVQSILGGGEWKPQAMGM